VNDAFRAMEAGEVARSVIEYPTSAGEGAAPAAATQLHDQQGAAGA
jgi:hypothetical protein